MTRYFEDLAVGETHDVGETTVTEDEIVEFAERYDPQPFHLDPEAARDTPVGELIASGWHTAAMIMRLMVDNFFDEVADVAAAGVEDLTWRRPVRPGDVLSASVEVVGLEPWNDDRGLAKLRVSATNEAGDLVHERVERVVIERRTPVGSEAAARVESED